MAITKAQATRIEAHARAIVQATNPSRKFTAKGFWEGIETSLEALAQILGSDPMLEVMARVEARIAELQSFPR